MKAVHELVKWDVSRTPWPLEDESVNVVVTSPPYWGLRDYGGEAVTIWGGEDGCKHEFEESGGKIRPGRDDRHYGGIEYGDLSTNPREYIPPGSSCIHCGAWQGQLGLEPHPGLYIKHVVEVSREIRRILSASGSFYLNIGDSYCGYWGDKYAHSQSFDRERGNEKDGNTPPNKPSMVMGCGWIQPKQLLGIPFRVMAALQNDGWILRNIIPWVKPNSMPSSVKDRRNNTWEAVFHFVRSQEYSFDLDAIREPHKSASIERDKYDYNSAMKGKFQVPWDKREGMKPQESALNPKGKNPGDVLEISTVGSPEAHYAVFPEGLVERLLLPHNGIAFDPFAGRGTVGKVAKRLGMDYILFDISEANLEIARRYIQRSDAGNYRKLEQRRNKPKVTDEGIQEELVEESFAK